MKLQLLFLILAFSSCTSLNSIKKAPERIPFTKLSSLNGTYEIASIGNYGMLDDCLTFKSRYTYKNLPAPKDKVVLKAIHKKTLLITLYHGDSVMAKRKARGKFEDNYFVYKQRSLRPFWLVLSAYQKRLGRIGILPDGNLTADRDETTVAFLTIVPLTGGKNTSDSMIFRRRLPQ